MVPPHDAPGPEEAPTSALDDLGTEDLPNRLHDHHLQRRPFGPLPGMGGEESGEFRAG